MGYFTTVMVHAHHFIDFHVLFVLFWPLWCAKSCQQVLSGLDRGWFNITVSKISCHFSLDHGTSLSHEFFEPWYRLSSFSRTILKLYQQIQESCVLRWVLTRDVNWWLLFLSTVVMFSTTITRKSIPIPLTLVLDWTHGWQNRHEWQLPNTTCQLFNFVQTWGKSSFFFKFLKVRTRSRQFITVFHTISKSTKLVFDTLKPLSCTSTVSVFVLVRDRVGTKTEPEIQKTNPEILKSGRAEGED
jgi:hypothetical protein